MDDSSNVIGSYVHLGKIAALVELSWGSGDKESLDGLQTLADGIAKHVAAMAPASIEELREHPYVLQTSQTLGEALCGKSASILRFVRWTAGELGGDGPSDISARAVA